MNTRKTASILLCVFLLQFILVGCGNSDEENTSGDLATPLPSPAADIHDSDNSHDHIYGIDFDSALAAFAPDTVMITADTFSVTWADMFVFLFRPIASLTQTYETGIDWSEEIDNNTTLADFILEYVTEEALSFLVLEYGAKSLNITLSDEDVDKLSEDIDNLIEMYGSKEELESSLRENGGFYNFEVFERLLKIEYTVGIIMTELYGDNSESFSDEDIIDFALRNDYMMAKHILILSTEDDNDTALSKIEDLLSQLHTQINDDDFFDIFDAMMHEHSEDSGGLLSSPNGYLFQPSDMVAPFSEACAALEIGHLSDIVETTYGYHIILRLPLDYDAVPIGIAGAGQSLTLRQLAAYDDFEKVSQKWRDSLNIVFTPEYHSIDLATIFKWN